MACKTKSADTAKKAALDGDQKAILKALKTAKDPIANKAIAEASGLDSKIVTKQMKKLRDMGYVDSPARCKYCITPEGKKVK